MTNATNTKLYLIFDERMALHKPPKVVDDPEHPDFVHERPARIYAVYSAIQRLEHKLQGHVVGSQLSKQRSNTIRNVEVNQRPDSLEEGSGRIIHLECHPATRETICLVHSGQHYRQMRYTSTLTYRALLSYPCDNDLYYCRDTFLAATLAAGGCVDCVNAVTSRTAETKRALAIVRPPGHHATRNHPMGFCFFNNVVVAAKYALHHNLASRVFILDWDVHHGNGIQDLTYDDPNIFYLSIHRASSSHDDNESAKNDMDYFYPGTGRHYETGRDSGVGTNLNIAWGRHGMGNVEYAAAFAEVVLPVLSSYQPDLVLIACGLDAAQGDLLGDCGLTPEMYYVMTKSVLDTAGVNTPVVTVLEGGYSLNVISECMEAVGLAMLDEPWNGHTMESNVGSSLTRYWRHELMQCNTSRKTTLQAIQSIRNSARSLAFSQSRLGAFSCIQSPCGCTCIGQNKQYCCKRQFHRPSMLQCDRYPAKKRLLVRATEPSHHNM